MDNCFLTKLKGSVTGDLPVLGQRIMDVLYYSDVDQQNYGMFVTSPKAFNVTIKGSYFTDKTGVQNYGQSMDLPANNTEGLYVKKPSSGNNGEVFAKLCINDVYYVTMIERVAWTVQNLPYNLPDLEWFLDLEHLKYNIWHPEENVDISEKFKKNLKLNYLNFIGGSNKVVLKLNDLAEKQMENGRDYQTYPTIQIICGDYFTYYNGSSIVNVSGTVFIVFKLNGYELRQDSATGTLLYDSLA